MHLEEQTEEEEFVYPPHPKLEFTLSNSQHFKCRTLVVAQYGPASLFAHSLIGPNPPVARLNFSKAKQQALADLFLSPSGQTLHLVFNETLPAMHQISLSTFLEKHVQTERIITLMSVARTTLKEQKCPTLTYIATSRCETPAGLSRFSEGVGGVDGELLMWGEVQKKCVLTLVAVVGEYQMSSEVIQELFGVLRGKYGLEGQFQIGERVKKYNIKQNSKKMYL